MRSNLFTEENMVPEESSPVYFTFVAIDAQAELKSMK